MPRAIWRAVQRYDISHLPIAIVARVSGTPAKRFDNYVMISGNLMSKSFAAGAAPTRRRIIKAGAALVGGIAAPAFLRIGSALAAYPERPVKIVVANTPGGPSDIIARIIAAELQIATGGT